MAARQSEYSIGADENPRLFIFSRTLTPNHQGTKMPTAGGACRSARAGSVNQRPHILIGFMESAQLDVYVGHLVPIAAVAANRRSPPSESMKVIGTVGCSKSPAGKWKIGKGCSRKQRKKLWQNHKCHFSRTDPFTKTHKH
jgi:hypothetical protein